MNIDTNISFEIDTDELYEEMEGNVHAAFENLVGEYGLQDYDEVNNLIDEKVPDAMAEYAEAIELMTLDNTREMVTAALEDHETEMKGELVDLDSMVEGMRTDMAFMTNEIEKARRSIRVLLEEREARLGMRIKRATHNVKGAIGRKVRQIKGRLTRKDTNND